LAIIAGAEVHFPLKNRRHGGGECKNNFENIWLHLLTGFSCHCGFEIVN